MDRNERARVKRHPNRGKYDRESVNAILDEGMVCHTAFQSDGQPFNIPMLYARIGEDIFIHTSIRSRFYDILKSGSSVCIAVTLLDGIVLAKSAFNSSMNYRSAVIFGSMTPVTEEAEKMVVSEAITEKIAKGRWNDCRRPNKNELKATGFLKMPISEFSVKVREGPPVDDPKDLDLEYWSGVIPVTEIRGTPVTSRDNANSTGIPGYL